MHIKGLGRPLTAGSQGRSIFKGRRLFTLMGLLVAVSVLVAACGPAGGGTGPSGAGQGNDRLTVYSGRNEALVGPLLERFTAETGIEVDVRYGNTGELASTLLEEGGASPADVFMAQDAGALGAVAADGLLMPMSDELLEQVEPRFRSPQGFWVGMSGRARVVAYNTDRLMTDDLPPGIWGFTEPQWRGRLGWAPTNASFQSFVTAIRVAEGEERAKQWLEGIMANQPRDYSNNVAAVEAVGSGEVDVAFVNHYYLFRLKSELGESFPVENYYLTAGDAGALINVAGAGVVASSSQQELAEQFIAFLLSEESQNYFAAETFEYPLAAGVPAADALPPVDEIKTPDLDLSNLSDLARTIELLTEVGAL